MIGLAATFTCQTGGTTYEIKKTGVTAAVSAAATYEITSFATSDGGEYKCSTDIAVQGTAVESDPVNPPSTGKYSQ